MKVNNLLQRTITGLVFASLVIGSILWNPYLQTVVFSIFMVLGLMEYYRLFKGQKEIQVSSEIGIFIGLFIFTLLVGISLKILPVISITFIVPLLFTLILVELWKKHEHPISNIALMVFGILYVVIPFYLTIDLNLRNTFYLPTVVGMFFLIWTNDTFAYVCGRLFGKHKLFERISPNKTCEGTICGIVFTLALGFSIGKYINEGNTFFWVISAVIIAPGSIFGDLLESLFKRSLNIKDTGTILPGHGGILDRFDAALFSIPFFYCWNMVYYYWN